MTSTQENPLHVGKISGVFGIKGWVKVFSYTGERQAILKYSPWILKKNNLTQTVEVLAGQLQGQAVVAQLKDINDRDAAGALIGWEIYIDYAQLPKLKQDEYYWSDLIGLRVDNKEGVTLGIVESLLETGANDVLVVQGEQRQHAVPFIRQHTVLNIDLVARTILVDWDADF
ncbi:MAG: hypothetical protein RLZZ66_559 [Pseudomonadota bacterium]